MSNSYFYIDSSETLEIFSKLEEYANENKEQLYVLKKPLGISDIYSYNDAYTIIIPNCKILILNLGSDSEKFNLYYEDFIQDIGFLSKKYKYEKYLGRPRVWNNLITKEHDTFYLDDIKELIQNIKEESTENIRKIELLTSLLIGSINDIDRVGVIPITTLDKVKRKIVLFDGIQSNFIYKTDKSKKEIRIQGLAGTGKTELLLHKIRELYVNEPNSSIVFTCYNKVLEDDMRDRIPKFFNFMKVEEQINWSRLKVMRAWGSGNNPCKGIYSFICNKYDIPFRPYGRNVFFTELCKDTIKQLEERNDLEPCFDYICIDESQDFDEVFFKLCSMVTRKKVFIAGDIFQNIFSSDISTANVDFILNRCYRTEPRTLMFAHAVGMGLYEKPKLRWLEDSEWNACGYIVDKQNNKYELTRSPIRRFEDIDLQTSTLVIKSYESNSIETEIKNCIYEIKQNNESVTPDDIAIIFLERNMHENYKTANRLENMIYEEFKWKINKGYETKQRNPDTIFISNINNIKGLEFPFVIVIADKKIGTHYQTRNSIYMALTRSLLNSYFFILNENNEEFIKIYTTAIQQITSSNSVGVCEPSSDEKKQITLNLQNLKKVDNNKIDILNDIIHARRLPKEKSILLSHISEKMLTDKDISDEAFIAWINPIIDGMV